MPHILLVKPQIIKYIRVKVTFIVWALLGVKDLIKKLFYPNLNRIPVQKKSPEQYDHKSSNLNNCVLCDVGCVMHDALCAFCEIEAP